MLILADKDIAFLKWLYNRLIYRYRLAEADQVSLYLRKIIEQILRPIEINISDDDLDKVLSKYYVDFYLNKESDNNNYNIGFTDEERQNLRTVTRNLMTDIINLNIPKNSLIKDK